jgi:hypothetical protein
VWGGGVAKAVAHASTTPAGSFGSARTAAAAGGWGAPLATATTTTTPARSGSSPPASASTPPSAAASCEGWLARRLGPPGLARYAAAHGLAAPTAAAAAAHWTGHALTDERAVANAFMAALARGRRVAGGA